MAAHADPMAAHPATSVAAGVFALLAVAAWFASPGVAIALAYYGALMISGRLYRRWRTSTTRLDRSIRFVGLALPWLVALACSMLMLPSNIGTALI